MRVSVIRIRIGNILIRAAKSVNEAFFPTRCLVCESFFHHGQPQNDDVKTCPAGANISNISPKLFAKNVLATSNEDSYLGNSTTIFEMLLAPFLCPACLTGFLPVESPMCSRCGVVFKSREGEDHVCGECLDSPKRFGIARSPGIYEQTLMAAIHCFKYRGKIQLARPFGMLLFTAFISFWEKNSVDLIIPVPLHVKKFRMRGFNPSFLLVRDWATIAEMLNDELPDIPVARDVLERRRWTEPQTGLGSKKRLTNVMNAFSINDLSKIVGKRVLLVDDVFTTGATANECAKVLLKGGAEHVDVLTLARAM